MEFVQVLLALVVAYLRGNYPSKDLSRALSPAARKMALESLPELSAAFAAYDRGEEFNWEELADGLKETVAVYSRSENARASYVKALNAFRLYFKTGSDAALRTIEKLSALVDDPVLNGHFVRQESDQKTIRVQLETLVKRLGGRGFALTAEQSKRAKEVDPEAYASYLALMREFNESWKTLLNNYVRATGRTYVPFPDFLKHLQQAGFTHTMPEGFTGNIDAVGNWYTDDGEPIDGGAPRAVMFPTVRMNPKRSEAAPWVFQAIRADGTPGNYFYTVHHQRTSAQEKFKKVASFNAEKVRKKWLPLLHGIHDFDNIKPKEVAAIVLEILYRSSNRIGTRPGGNPTGGGFGVSTLLVGHFYPQTDGSVKFIYLGKDDVKTTTTIKPSDTEAKIVCQAVYALVEGKTKREPVFTYRLANGQTKLVQPKTVTEYFQSISGGLNPHKLRTARGTKMFRQYLEKVYEKYPKLTAKQAMEVLKKGGELVGKQLNHVKRAADGTTQVVSMTALKNYIDAALQIEFFQHYGVPVPTFLEKFLNEEETAAVGDADSGEEGDQADAIDNQLLIDCLSGDPMDVFMSEFG